MSKRNSNGPSGSKYSKKRAEKQMHMHDAVNSWLGASTQTVVTTQASAKKSSGTPKYKVKKDKSFGSLSGPIAIPGGQQGGAPPSPSSTSAGAPLSPTSSGGAPRHVLREGYLTKQGGHKKTWKKRWFLLKPNLLYYYKTKQESIAHIDKKATGVIYLDGCFVKAVDLSSHKDTKASAKDNKEHGKQFGIQIFHAQRRTYFMYASSEAERQEWIEAFLVRWQQPTRVDDDDDEVDNGGTGGDADDDAHVFKKGLTSRSPTPSRASSRDDSNTIEAGADTYDDTVDDEGTPRATGPQSAASPRSRPPTEQETQVYARSKAQRMLGGREGDDKSEVQKAMQGVRKSGMLWRREGSSVSSDWKKKWFVLKDNVMYYSNGHLDIRLQMAITLEGYTVNYIDALTKKTFSFEVVHPESVCWTLHADCHEDREDWYHSLQESINLANQIHRGILPPTATAASTAVAPDVLASRSGDSNAGESRVRQTTSGTRISTSCDFMTGGSGDEATTDLRGSSDRADPSESGSPPTSPSLPRKVVSAMSLSPARSRTSIKVPGALNLDGGGASPLSPKRVSLSASLPADVIRNIVQQEKTSGGGGSGRQNGKEEEDDSADDTVLNRLLHSLSLTEEGEEVQYSGYLLREQFTPNGPVWIKQWCVLLPRYMQYFDKPDDDSPLGVVRLRCCRLQTDTKKRAFAFALKKARREHHFAAKDSIAFKEWSLAVRRCVAANSFMAGGHRPESFDRASRERAQGAGDVFERGGSAGNYARGFRPLTTEEEGRIRSWASNPLMNIADTRKRMSCAIEQNKGGGVTAGPLSDRDGGSDASSHHHGHKKANPPPWPAMGLPVLKEGYLTKRGGGKRKKWQVQWFMLKNLYLGYFVNAKAAAENQPKAWILLDKCSVEAYESKGKFCFSISTEVRTYYIMAKTRQERDEWVEAIRPCISREESLWDDIIELNSEHLQFFEEEGMVMIKGGTLERLIDILTLEEGAAADFDLHFLLTFPSFTTPLIVLDELIYRYNSFYETEELQRTIRGRVVEFLSTWIVQHFTDFSSDEMVMKRLNTFIDNSMDARKLRELIKKKLNEQEEARQPDDSLAPPPELPINLQGTPATLMNLSPLEVARQLALYEHSLLNEVNPREFLNSNWTKRDKDTKAHNLVELIEHFNRISRLVSTSIVLGQTIAERVEAITAFIQIGWSCLELRNYSGVMQVLSGLESSAVTRLKKTWAEVPPASKKIHAELSDLMSMEGNFKSLRRLLGISGKAKDKKDGGGEKEKETKEKSKDKDSKEKTKSSYNKQSSDLSPCVPYIGVFLTDLTFISDGNPDQLGNGLINFIKQTMVGKILRKIQEFQEIPYALVEVGFILDLLMNGELLDDDAALYRESLAREERAA
eukprot:TRINITY_DN281_c0_g4_i1.p1 TRINITY_DN281_c0_g4~~TRINITY_DN281_c0_g4_i1.p1  ORF type:complete len:1382 (-),score=400.10 TRINITY_DN281_c0_g4_i1:56-4201(-)